MTEDFNPYDPKRPQGLELTFYFRKIEPFNGIKKFIVEEPYMRLIEVIKEIFKQLDNPPNLDEIAVVEIHNYLVLSITEVNHFVASLNKWVGKNYIITKRELVNGPDLSLSPNSEEAKKPRKLESYRELLFDPKDLEITPEHLGCI